MLKVERLESQIILKVLGVLDQFSHSLHFSVEFYDIVEPILVLYIHVHEIFAAGR